MQPPETVSRAVFPAASSLDINATTAPAGTASEMIPVPASTTALVISRRNRTGLDNPVEEEAAIPTAME